MVGANSRMVCGQYVKTDGGKARVLDLVPEEKREIIDMVRRLPQWLRADLFSADPTQRERAEDTLAAMFAAFIAEGFHSGNSDRQD